MADFQQWFHLLEQQLMETDALQWFAVILGVAEVLFARVNNIWLYPTGIAGTLLSMFILYEAGLYAECLLNGYYLVMSIYGWRHWVKKSSIPEVKVSWSTIHDYIISGIIVIFGFTFLYLLLKHYTPSTVPAWDAWVSATAWAGMWLLAKRKVENWIILNISNAFAIPLLFYKGLPMYAILTIILFAVAIQGHIAWSRIARKENKMELMTTI